MNLPAVLELTRALRETLRQKNEGPIELYTESLDLDRFDSPEIPLVFEDYIRRKYRNLQIDALVVLGIPALRYVSELPATRWPGSPVIFGGVTRQEFETLSSRDRFSGVLIDPPYVQTVKEALRLLPGTQRVALISGCARRDMRTGKAVLAALSAEHRGVQFEDFGCLTMEDYKARLSTLPPRSIALWANLNRDRSSRLQQPADAAKLVLQSASVPVFAVWESHLDTGIVGGKMFDARLTGGVLGLEVVRVLDGGAGQSIRTVSAGQWKWDWRQLQKFGIDEGRLPAGSIIVNRDMGLWSQYKEWIVGFLVLATVQSLLLGFLLAERNQRSIAQIRLRQLSGALLNAQETERTRLSRELHDDVNQRLGLLTIELDQLRESGGGKAWSDSVDAIARKARDLSGDVHAMAHRLHPIKLQYLGLVPAIREICQEVALRHGIDVDVEAQALQGQLAADAKVSIYRVIQEALQNIVKHSSADQVCIRIEEEIGRFVVVVSDNGHGFDPGSLPPGKGLGLASMRERLRLVHGTLRVESKPGAGAKIAISVPLESDP